MARRIDVELTSARDDGTWTWRAAGAKQPKGTLDGAVLYEGARVGDVVRAEAEFEVDGITIVAVLPPKAKRAAPEKLEVKGSVEPTEGVTTELAGPLDRPRDRPRRERGAAGSRGPREGRETGERRPRQGQEAGRGRGPRRGEGERAPAGPRERSARPARPVRPARPEPAPRPKPKRLQPGRAHREHALGTLSPEERAVAERVLRGGIPAVRQAVDEQNAQARAEGKPEVKADALVAIAEGLLPRLRTAEWLDRAEAAAHDLDTVALRDLRAVVVGADGVARDDATRSLAATLRAALDRRAEQERTAWVDEIRAALDDGRVVRALRISSRPPDAGMAFPADLTERLTTAAGEALTPEASVDRWTALLDALAWSPVRTTVKPTGVPAEPDDALRAAVTKLASRLPAIASQFGIEAPPPPGPRGARPGGPARRSRRGPSGGTDSPDRKRRIPAPPPSAPKAAATPETTPEAAPAPTPPPGGDSFADAVAAATLSLGGEDGVPRPDSEPAPEPSPAAD